MPRQLSQQDFARLTMKAAMEKLQIQEKLKNGLSVVELSQQYNVGRGTMVDVLNALDIKHGREEKKKYAQSNLMESVLTVLARLAKQLDVDYTEIKPYLVNEKE